uniref:Uncharacterized protein n=1 Tax=Aegilops tauschii subsp. strangulata TaxID=200361 RepID=A0A453FJA4_AEGTS
HISHPVPHCPHHHQTPSLWNENVENRVTGVASQAPKERESGYHKRQGVGGRAGQKQSLLAAPVTGSPIFVSLQSPLTSLPLHLPPPTLLHIEDERVRRELGD